MIFKGVNTKCEEHKKEIAIGLGVVVCVAGGVLLWRNQEAILDFAEKMGCFLKKSTVKSQSTPKAVTVAPTVTVIEMAETIVTETMESSAKVIKRRPHSVRLHVMNLPESKHPSPEKILLAIQEGIELDEHQTIRCAYETGKNMVA